MRYASIDLLRAVAIVLMVVVHFLENLAGADWAPAGLGAPLFAFLLGVSYRLWATGQEANGRDDEHISKVTTRRGLFLFGLGFAFNVLVWLPEDTFNWDVLTMLGTALLVLNAVRRRPPAVAVVLAAVALALAPVLQQVADYPAYWEHGYFECDLTLGDVALGFLVTGYFPLFPWLAFPLAGFVTATVFFDRDPGDPPPTGRAALLGATLAALAGAAVVARRFVPGAAVPAWTMFPPSVVYLTGTLGLVLLAFSLCLRWLDATPRGRDPGGVLGVAATMSRHSLSMYLFHHAVHLWPLWAYGAATGHEPTHFWRAALPAWAAVLLAPVCLGVGYALFRWMDRTERRGVEGWMRYLCD